MITTSLITFADFEQMPYAPGKQELIDGELIEMPPAKHSHMHIAKRIFVLLLSGATGKMAHIEMGYRIGGGWLVPDVSVSRPNQEITDDYLIGSPSLAVEVLSPCNSASQIERKLSLYFAEGAEEIWVINPSKRTMSVYCTGEEGVLRTTVRERHESKFGAIALAALFDSESA